MDDKNTTRESPFVSIVIPCLNEQKFIALCLDSIIRNDYPKDLMEIIVVDGCSNDDTAQIVEGYVQKYQFIKILLNPKKIQSAALNIGISCAVGNIVMRMDAHCFYPPNYISELIRWMVKSGADNVGGVCETKSASDSVVSQAIAVALSHAFGVGNSYFRIGSSVPRWVDTVPFGCYRKEIFDRIGLFDEEMIRSQDDEFNYRLIKKGGRILLVPGVVISYFARDTLLKMWRMNFQYGYFKPLVARKNAGIATFRQIIPPLFILYLVIYGPLALTYPALGVLGIIPLLLYIFLNITFSISGSFKHDHKVGIVLLVVFPLLHFSYGLGYLKGMIDFLLFRRNKDMSGVSITR